MANVFYLAGFIEAWGRGYEKIREAFEKEKLEVPVFEEVRGGMMATIKREKFMAIQAKGGVVETASSIASKIKLSPRTIQRELTRLKELNVIKREGPDNGGHWIILKDLEL